MKVDLEGLAAQLERISKKNSIGLIDQGCIWTAADAVRELLRCETHVKFLVPLAECALSYMDACELTGFKPDSPEVPGAMQFVREEIARIKKEVCDA